MAGSPLKRQRKQGIRLDDGRIIAFPYMPRVADLPLGRQDFSAAQKIEHLIGLDRCYQILSWGPITALDPLRRREMPPAERKIGDTWHVWNSDDAAVVETDALLARSLQGRACHQLGYVAGVGCSGNCASLARARV